MNSAGADEIGKLFVGGLDWSTTQETLRSYFSQYGEVVDCVIMKDKTTNQSRGFGFVKFKDPNCVGTVLASRPHTLDGRNIDPKPCTPRGMQPERTRPKEGWKGPRSDSSKSNKIFVGGIPHNCGETELREYFKKFGVVTAKSKRRAVSFYWNSFAFLDVLENCEAVSRGPPIKDSLLCIELGCNI